MTKNAEKYLARMIKIYGYEHEIVLQFAQACEDGMDDEMLRVIVRCHELSPVYGF